MRKNDDGVASYGNFRAWLRDVHRDDWVAIGAGQPDSAFALTPTPSITPAPLPTPDVTWDFEIDPPNPHVGETFKVTAAASAPGGLAHYRINLLPLEAPLLEFNSEEGVSQNQMGVPASFQLTALEEGENTLQVAVDFETQACDLPGMPGCVYYFVYVTSPVQTVNVLPPVLGDVDCNGDVVSIDALLILQFNAALISALSCQDAADINDDGDISAVDAALVLQYVAGLIEAL